MLIIGVLYKSFKALFSFIQNGIKNAIAAPEIENLFRVAMGNMANEAAIFAEQLRNCLGLDPYVTKQALGTFQNLTTSMGIASQTAYKMSKSLVLLGNDMASLYNVDPKQASDNLQSAITGQWEAVRKYGYVLSEATIKQTALKYGIVSVGQELSETQKVLARYLTLLEQSKNAQGDMARTIDSVQNQLRVFQQNISAAGRSIGTAFIPFIQAALPWLNAFAIILQRVGVALARFTFGLFGKDYDKYVKEQQTIVGGTESVTDGLDSIGDAAKEAGKKAKGALAPFDELNVIGQQIQDNQSSSGSAGGGLEFDVPTLDIPDGENPFDKLADKIMEFFKNTDPYEIGKMLAEKINEAVASINWRNVGQKIGSGLQWAFSFALGFLREINTDGIGKAVASTINGIFDTLNPDTVGKTFGAFWNRVFDLIYGFAVNLEWERIGTWVSAAIMSFVHEFDFKKAAMAAAELINGIVKLLYNAVTKTDWKKIAKEFSDGINRFFFSVDWKQLGKTANEIVIRFLDMLNEFFEKTNWKRIGKSFEKALSQIDFVKIFEKAFKLVKNVAKSFMDVLDNIFGKGVISIGVIATAFAGVVSASYINKSMMISE